MYILLMTNTILVERLEKAHLHGCSLMSLHAVGGAPIVNWLKGLRALLMHINRFLHGSTKSKYIG